MAKLGTHDIRSLARSIISENPGGIRYSVLVDRISTSHPETPRNTILLCFALLSIVHAVRGISG